MRVADLRSVTIIKLLLLMLMICSVLVLQGCSGSNQWSLPQGASNLLPTTVITGPLPDSISYEGLIVTFAGSATDTEDGVLTGGSLVWTSDVDGQIGTGLTFDITTLSRNTHVITLTATDASGATGTASVTIMVNAEWFDAQWGFRQMITIDADMTPSDQTNFPVLIKLTDGANPLFGRAQADGDDIYFTEDDGVSQIPHEIEYYMDTGTEELDAWVRIEDLSSVSDTMIFMYYGNPGAPNQENVNGVWDGNYQGVWHMAEDPSTNTDGDCSGGTAEVCDSTSKNNHGDSCSNSTCTVLMGPEDQVSGKIGGSLDFDGGPDQDHISTPNISTASFTVSAWIFHRGIIPVCLNPPVYGGAVIGNSTWSGSFIRGYVMRYWCDDLGFWYIKGAGGTRRTFTELNTWTYVAMTYDGTSTVFTAYDNAEVVQIPVSAAFTPSTTPRLYFGRDFTNSGSVYFHGNIDEVRISDVARSDDWILTEYNNQNNPATYLTFDPEEVF